MTELISAELCLLGKHRTFCGHILSLESSSKNFIFIPLLYVVSDNTWFRLRLSVSFLSLFLPL